MVKVSPWAVRASRSSRKLKPRPQMPVDSTETMVHYSNLLFISRTTAVHSQQEPEAPVTPDKPRAMRSSMRVKQKMKKNMKMKTWKKKKKHKTGEGIYKRPIPMVISWARRAARSDCDRRPMKQSGNLLLSSPTNLQSPNGSTIIVLQEEMLEKLLIEQSGREHQVFAKGGECAPTIEETLEQSKIEVSKVRPLDAYQDSIILKDYLNAKAEVVVIHKGDDASIFEKTLEESEIEISKALPTEEHQAFKEVEAPVPYEWVSVGASVYEEASETKIEYNKLRSIEKQHAFKQTDTHATHQAHVHDEYLITSAPSVEEAPKKPDKMICDPQPTKQHDSMTHQAQPKGTIEEMLEKCNDEFNGLQVVDEHEGAHMYNFDRSSQDGVYEGDQFGGIYMTSRAHDNRLHEGNTTSVIEEPQQNINIELNRLRATDGHHGVEVPSACDYSYSSQHGGHNSNAVGDKEVKQKYNIKLQKIKKKKKIRPKIKEFMYGSQNPKQPKNKENKGPKRRYTRKNKGWNLNSEDATKFEYDATNAPRKAVDRQSPPVKRSLNFDSEDKPVGVGTENNSTRPYIESTLDQKKLVAEDSDVRHFPSRRETIQKLRQTFRVKSFLRRLNLSLGGKSMDVLTKGNFARTYTKLTLKPNKLAIKSSVGSRPSRRECLKKRLNLLAVRNQMSQDLVNLACRSYITSNPSCVTLYKDFYGQFCGTLCKDFYGQLMKVDKNGRHKRKKIENLQECLSSGLPTSDGQLSQAIVPYIKPTYDNMEYLNMIKYAIVPFGGHMLDPYKKPRVKVHLDYETEREYKLLMGKKDKDESSMGNPKYWEDERILLHHRIDAFTAQMNLIQGDRRFSRWGGSVVDSIVGAFLTQNVSDHLSSSAFMAIAARFPARSNFTDENLAMKEMSGSITCLGSTTKGVNVGISEEHFGSTLNHLHPSHHSHNSKDTILGQNVLHKMPEKSSITERSKNQTEESRDWDILRKDVLCGLEGDSNSEAPDIVDWEAVRSAGQAVLAEIIKDRGMHNQLGKRILDFLNRTKNNHGSINLEWLRKVLPDKAKEYLLDIFGLGLKSTECIRLLSLEQKAFPVDTNVGRICVRLGWVPLMIDPRLPESTQIHLLEQYPLMDGIQKYLWTRLYTLDKRTLYELHYQLITFGKVFCTKVKPNCKACPMRGSCKHYASASSSARLLTEGPEKKNPENSSVPDAASIDDSLALTIITSNDGSNSAMQSLFMSPGTIHAQSEPIIEFPESPKYVCNERLEQGVTESLVDNEDAYFVSSEDFGDTGDIEDYYDPDEIQFIDLTKNITQNYWDGVKGSGLGVNYDEFSKANYVPTITPKTRKLKKMIDLRTQHEVYEIPDGHHLLEGMDPRVPNDPCPYLLSIWSPGEISQSSQIQEDEERNDEIVKATFLIPSRTANRGAFPLNGTYFQTNEVFADHASSMKPIDVQMTLIENFPRRTLYVGSSTYAIFRGMASTDEIGFCFQRGNICVRGFDRETRRPMRLTGRLHSKLHKGMKSKKPDNVRGGKAGQKRN